MVQTGAPHLVPLARILWALARLVGIFAIAPGLVLDTAAFVQKVLDDEIHHFRIRQLPPISYRSSLFEAIAPVRRSRLGPPVGWTAAPAIADLGPLDLREGAREKRSDGVAASPLVTGVELFQKLDVAVDAHQ